MIDINCDVGEGMDNEEELFPYVTSCNIACGGHAGTEESMRKVVRLAQKYGVAIGAHPSYPDTANFGRVSMPIEEDELIISIQRQITSLLKICEEEGAEMKHIKAHGALYNDCFSNENIAGIYLKAITPFKSGRLIFMPYGSSIESLAKEGHYNIFYEAFPDRAYEFDLSLSPRTQMFSVISDVDEILYRVAKMQQNTVPTQAGEMQIIVDTYCVHSDTPNALELVRALHKNYNLTFKMFGSEGLIIEWPALLTRENLYQRIRFFHKLREDFGNHHEVVLSMNSITILGLAEEAIPELKSLLKAIVGFKSAYNRYKIPVCYDEAFALDLKILALEKGLTEHELIELHCSSSYPVFSGGFLPGFLYLGDVNEALYCDRLAMPRMKIPAGSVGLGGKQTGIYPQDSPGGWRIIGKTPVKMFDLENEQPNLAEPGDEIQFYAVDKAEFDRLSSKIEQGEFEIEKEVFNA